MPASSWESSIPAWACLANGTEDEKGSNFTKACFPAMKAAVPGFVGNCEGTDITSGNFDVVVADGMSGNIALKATEGAAKFLLQELKGVFMSSLGTKIAALLIKKQMREIKAKAFGRRQGRRDSFGPARRGPDRPWCHLGRGCQKRYARGGRSRARRAGRECRQLYGRYRFIRAS